MTYNAPCMHAGTSKKISEYQDKHYLNEFIRSWRGNPHAIFMRNVKTILVKQSCEAQFNQSTDGSLVKHLLS